MSPPVSLTAVPTDPFEPFRARPDRAAVLTDFDGTLSLIVEDWNDARPLPGAAETLDALAERYAVVGVISGRPVSYLHAHLGDAVRLSGLYGLEVMHRGERIPVEGAEEWRPAVDRAFADAAKHFGDFVEHKGLSLTVHFRTRPDIGDAVIRWAQRMHDETGLELRAAKASIELHPPVKVDKGTVVELAAAHLDAVCFLGDDVGDLPAFAALERLRDRGVHTVKVGVSTPEAPPAVLDRADVVVDGPNGALALLQSL